MNYITVINNFWEKHRQAPVSAGAVALFFTILNHANKNRWQFPLYLTNSFVQAELRISQSSFFRYRHELSENGYITFFSVNLIVGSGYSIAFSNNKKAAKSAYDTCENRENTVGNTCGNTCENTVGNTFGNTCENEKSVSSYNNKNININKDINKDFKQKSLYKKEKYNQKEIYDSGRYDFDEIERVARKKIREAVAKYAEEDLENEQQEMSNEKCEMSN